MRTIRNNAKTCRQIGGMSMDLHCYINNDHLEEIDIRCENIGGIIREIPVTARVSNFICEVPLDSLSKIPEDKINLLIKKEQDVTSASYYLTEKNPQSQNIKKLNSLFDKMNECFYGDKNGHIGKCKSGEDMATLIKEAKKTLKKMPYLPEDER